MLEPFEQNNHEIRLISRRKFLFQYHATLTLFLLLFFKQVNNGSQCLTIYASPRFFWLGHKTSVQVVSPVCISVCKSHDIMLRQQKKMQYFFNIVFCRKKLEKNAYIHNNECVLHCCIIKILKDENWPWFYLVTAYYFWQPFDAIIWQPCIP